MNKLVQHLTDNSAHFLNFIGNLCGNKDSAEDIYQDLCLQIHKADKDLPDEDIPKYLFESARNVFLNWRKKQRAEKRFSIHAGEYEEDLHPDQVGLTFDQLHASGLELVKDPLTQLLQAEEAMSAQDRIGEVLNPKHREVLTAVFIEDLTYKTAAEACNVSYDSVRQICTRFKESVRKG